MACPDCDQSLVSLSGNFFANNPCIECGSQSTSSSCVYYTGTNLANSGINNLDSIEVALQKIDTLLVAASGIYSTYNYNCLTVWLGTTIATESQFVEAITDYACETRTFLDTFTDTTFPDYQSTIGARIALLEVPSISCPSSGIVGTDTLQQILSKYCIKISSLNASTNLTGINWSQCFTVITPPTTIAAGFSTILDQICQVKSSASSLPIFDNISSCLASPLTGTDTLVSTINKIKARLCLTPTWLSTNVTWGCVGSPVSTVNIEEAIQRIVTSLNAYTQAVPTFDTNDFVVAVTNPSDPCAGVTISLVTPINQDRFVAVNTLDSTPGTLITKLAGVGIGIDDTTNPGQITLTSTATTDNFTVKANTVDTNPDFLDNKVNGSTSNGITLSPVYNALTQKVDFNLLVNSEDLFNYLLDNMDTGSVLYEKFCEKVRGCPSECEPPSNIQAVAQGSTTTVLP